MLKARLVQVVRYQINLGKIWDNPPCEKSEYKYHRAELVLQEVPTLEEANGLAHIPDRDDPVRKHPKLQICERCGASAPNEGMSAGARSIYNTASGRPEPGDLYCGDWYRCKERGHCLYGWTNCDGIHLIAVLPNGHPWDIDSRASNCTMPEENTHRCWVRTGTPPNVTAGKNGKTCGAGAGSIAVPGYHGFLHNGHFT